MLAGGGGAPGRVHPKKSCLCPRKNTVCKPPQCTSAKTPKNSPSALPCSSGPHAAAGPSAITLWMTPTKLTGNLAPPLLDTPFKAICVIFITFNEMSTILHHVGFIATGGGARSPAARRQWQLQCSGKRDGSAAAVRQHQGGSGGSGGGSATA